MRRFFLAAALLLRLPLLAQIPVRIMDGEIDYLFNERLTVSEQLSLREGGTVCNSIGKVKYARIREIPETEQLLMAVRKARPNHLAEIIRILPYEGFENLTETVSQMLKSEESYTTVPFYVKDNGDVVHLYSEARIESVESDGSTGREVIAGRFQMRPLDQFSAYVEAEKRGSYYFYHMKNTSRVRYKSFISAVGKEKMIAVISIFRYGDNWIIYALGGVDIIKLPFIDRRIDRAFYNRVKAFCVFTFERLEEFGSADEEN